MKQRLGNDVKNKLLAEIQSESDSTVPVATQSQIGSFQAASIMDKADFGLVAAIQAAQRSFCITDPSLPDNPIIFASKGFCELSGYQLEDILGRNCRFLQGPGTDQMNVDVLRRGIKDGVDTSICLLNYKADGTPFYNQIFVAALRDASNKIINYVGVQVEVRETKLIYHISQYSVCI